MRFNTQMNCDAAADAFLHGAVLGYPTEGVWGIGCSAYDSAGIRRVLQIKKRAPNKGLILLVSDPEQLQDFVLDQAEVEKAIASGPEICTWVVKAAPSIDPLLTGSRDSLAVRCTTHVPMRRVLDRIGIPIISTSANLSGAAPSGRPWLTHFGSTVDGWMRAPLGGLGHPTPIRQSWDGRYLRGGQ
ncbi:MAG: L-threonylcarbamoyladenylate synthase [Litorivicinus sp.]